MWISLETIILQVHFCYCPCTRANVFLMEFLYALYITFLPFAPYCPRAAGVKTLMWQQGIVWVRHCPSKWSYS